MLAESAMGWAWRAVLAWRGMGASCGALAWRGALAWSNSMPGVSLARRPVLALWVRWAVGCASRRVRRWMGVSIWIGNEHLDR